MVVGVPDDVAASLIEAENDQVPLAFDHRAVRKEFADEAPDQTQIAGVAGEFYFAFLQEPGLERLAALRGGTRLSAKCIPLITMHGGDGEAR